MDDLISRLRMNPALEIVEAETCWKVCVPKSDGIVFETIIPRDVLEWFVSAKRADTDQEIWSDWADYSGYFPENDRTPQDLQTEMKADITGFLDCLLASTVRLVEVKTFLGRRTRLEWKSAGVWKKVSLHTNSEPGS